MPREKKEAKNFACKFDKAIFDKLEEFCRLSGMSKTNVVERAVEKYVEENMELVESRTLFEPVLLPFLQNM